jgi:hypothetical protein
LIHAIGEQLVPSPPPRGAGVPFTESQLAAIGQAADFLARGDLLAAQRRLQ